MHVMMAVMSKNDAKPSKKSSVRSFGLLFGLPVGLLLLSLLALTLPRVLAQPSYDFIYSYCPSFSCRSSYGYEAGQIQESSTSNNRGDQPQLRYYSAEDDSHHTISLDEANELQINESSRAPDGYQLTYQRGSDSGFLFFYSSGDSNWVLERDWRSKPINLSTDSRNRSNVTFIGWVAE